MKNEQDSTIYKERKDSCVVWHKAEENPFCEFVPTLGHLNLMGTRMGCTSLNPLELVQRVH